MGQAGLCLMYIHNDTSICTDPTIKKLAAQIANQNFDFLQRFYIATREVIFTIFANLIHF